MKNKKTLLVVGAAILLAVAGVGFWYWSKNKQAPPAQTQETPTLGGQISETLQNPISGKIPDTNPFENQKNPFDVIYTNPFK